MTFLCHWSLLVVVVLAAACASPPAPEIGELGSRVRVRIVSRGEVASITTARYRLLVCIRGPEGRVESFGVSAPRFSESESIGGSLAAKFKSVLDLPNLEFVESLQGAPELVHDFVLPKGYALDFTPGRFFAYRVAANGRLVADLAPEIRFGQITADGSRYLELAPTAGPDLGEDDDPPGWPPRER
jgi:hypothetical protein